jgi:hypothetical protein
VSTKASFIKGSNKMPVWNTIKDTQIFFTMLYDHLVIYQRDNSMAENN